MNRHSRLLLPFEEAVEDVSRGNRKVQRGDYLSRGRYPVIDQGQDLIGGYTNDPSNVVSGEGPWIVFGDHTRALKYVDFPFCMGADGVKVLKPRGDLALAPKFLFHFLQTREIPSAGYSRHFKFLKKVEIPLPPLDEQRRIAAILDKADALRRKRKRALELLEGLTQSIFLEMFGDPQLNPRKWPRKPLEEIASIEAPLINPTKAEFSQLLHFGPDRIERDTGRLLPAQTALEDGLVSGKFLCNEHHILYSKIRPYLNKVALAPHRCLCSADVYPVSGNTEVVDRHYLWFLLRSSAFLSYAESCSNRANIPKLNRKQFLEFEAMLPPLDLQQVFSQRISHIFRLTGSGSRAMEDSARLFASLQSRAFSGQL